MPYAETTPRAYPSPRRGKHSVIDEVADDLAVWLDQTANQLAAAILSSGRAPFSADLSEGDKLAYYTQALFNRDGSPNTQGRLQQMQRLGPETFAQVYKAVITARPELRQEPWEASPAPDSTQLIPPPGATGGPA